MKYQIIADHPENHDQIMQAVKKSHDDLGGSEMKTEIENDAGEVYMVVITEGLSQYLSLTSNLCDFMTDKYLELLHSPDGVDSRFVQDAQ